MRENIRGSSSNHGHFRNIFISDRNIIGIFHIFVGKIGIIGTSLGIIGNITNFLHFLVSNGIIDKILSFTEVIFSLIHKPYLPN